MSGKRATSSLLKENPIAGHSGIINFLLSGYPVQRWQTNLNKPILPELRGYILFGNLMKRERSSSKALSSDSKHGNGQGKATWSRFLMPRIPMISTNKI